VLLVNDLGLGGAASLNSPSESRPARFTGYKAKTFETHSLGNIDQKRTGPAWGDQKRSAQSDRLGWSRTTQECFTNRQKSGMPKMSVS